MATYWFSTPGSVERSIAYFTSAEVTSRSTGGLKRDAIVIVKVIVLPSSETSGSSVARSGDGWSRSPGCQLSRFRWAAIVTIYVCW